MAEWLIPCNMRIYDVCNAFNELKAIDWKQSSNIKCGDIVYIYVGKHISAVMYKCYVNKTDKPEVEIDDSKYVIDGTNYTNYGRYMELEVLEKYGETLLTYKNIFENGETQVRGPHIISAELSKYIDSVTEKTANAQDEQFFIQNVNSDFSGNKKRFTFKGITRKKQEPLLIKGCKIYRRDRKVAINALSHADYKCEVDLHHEVFIRKNSDKGYTEPHHLVPLAFSDKFNVSLDVEENIVSLCSNCHNQIHYGAEIKSILTKLYYERKSHLEKVGIIITLEELLEMYK